MAMTNPFTGHSVQPTQFRQVSTVRSTVDLAELEDMSKPVTLPWASAYARHLMQEHGLHGWYFDWDRSQRRYGCCHYGPRKITMSHHLAVHRTRKQVRNTILHEIAHALTPGHGHDATWRAMAIKLGCDGKRCAEVRPETAPKPPWALYCKDCGKTLKTGFRRTSMTNRHHAGCPRPSENRYITATLFWKANT